MKNSKLLYQIVTFAMLLALVVGCAAPAAAPTAAPAAPADATAVPAAPVAPAAGAKIVGISMPTKTSTRWISDGNSMVASFEALGYKTDLQFADNDIQNQL
ncbi:partial Multiple sugar-binding periplasmic protein SbpA, partial [Planctomycetaceae bacterium]